MSSVNVRCNLGKENKPPISISRQLDFSYPPFCFEAQVLLHALIVVFLLMKESKINKGVRSIFCVLVKEEHSWWKKLLRGDSKTPHYIKVDWDKWADEDEDGNVSYFHFFYFREVHSMKTFYLSEKDDRFFDICKHSFKYPPVLQL